MGLAFLPNDLPKSGTILDVQQVIDRQEGRVPQLALLVVITMTMMVDGFDTYLLGTIAPAVAKELGEPVLKLTAVFFFQAIGMALGSLVFGTMSDRIGRKKLLLLCLMGFGIFNVGAATAQSLWHMSLFRSIGGFFIAGVIPVAVTLLTEFSPLGKRSFYVTIVFAGYAAGAAASALATIWVLPVWGWQGCFVVGGVAPFLMIPLLAAMAEESIQFRVRRNPSDTTLLKSIRRIEPSIDLGTVTSYRVEAVSPERPVPMSRRSFRLFSDGRMLMTVLIWVTFFVGIGKIALLTSWISTLYVELGDVPLSVFARCSFIAFVGSMVGSPIAGLLMDHWDGIRVLTIIYIVEAMALALLGSVTFDTPICIALFFIWGFCQAGGQGGINALCAQIYPSGIRSTGLGWAFGMGRIGSIAMPLLGGLLLASKLSLAQFMFVLALLPLLVGLVIFVTSRIKVEE